MKTNFSISQAGQRGSGLLVTVVMTAIVLATLAGALAWSSSTVRLNERANQYVRSTAAAEGNTEMVVASITRDFKNGGAKLVEDNRSTYPLTALSVSNSPTWAGWQFKNTGGTAGRTYVEIGNFTNYVEIDSTYAGLKAFACDVKVVSNAGLTNTVQDVVSGVGQNFQLANIPIFQFAMFSSGYMEISCGAPFNITGKVHANGELYVEPDDALTFTNDVTAVGDILFQRHPLDTRTAPKGTVDYRTRHDAHVPALSMPIGTNNSPLAIREIIQPAPAGESTNSILGRQRYHNLADLIVTATSAGGIQGRKGIPFGNGAITGGQFTNFISVGTNFFDWREMKTVRPIDISIARLNAWNLTNRALFGGRDLMSIYVMDNRSLLPTELSAVRVVSGATLPPSGLTIATARPLYIKGHYNAPLADRGTTNTTATMPASLVADAITILSSNWKDADSLLDMESRYASNTTVNAAFLTGVVETTLGHYGGGMENFPRFMEYWGDNSKLAYNGSMVKMFPSLYATNTWGSDNTYDPPARNWSYDGNFNIASKLPPLTPNVQRVTRGQWATLAPNATNTAPLGL